MFLKKNLHQLILSAQNKSGSYEVNLGDSGDQVPVAQHRRRRPKKGSLRLSLTKRFKFPTATNNNNNNDNPQPRPVESDTVCTLGAGTTFGANGTSGKTHSVTVMTNDQCTLLRVRRADFQEIFNEQSHLIKHIESSPLCSFTSVNRQLVLSKKPHERSQEEIDMVFEELQHLKALSHLTNGVKKQLASCVSGEAHAKQNTVIFNQGDIGHSWYIILRGSVNVVIVGKGVVCTLHEGDDFGKLALVNDAPRAATIVTSEPNTYFLRVDKQDFNSIIRDVEANTVRLKEHGKEVLILQKVAIRDGQSGNANSVASSAAAASVAAAAAATTTTSTTTTTTAATTTTASSLPGANYSCQQAELSRQFHDLSTEAGGGGSAEPAGQQALAATNNNALKYVVMAGTAEKMLEHLLETRIDDSQIGAQLAAGGHQDEQLFCLGQNQADNFLEDFILTHRIFMPTANLCQELLKQYQCHALASSQCLATSGALAEPLHGKQQQPAHLSSGSKRRDEKYLVARKRRVVKFLRYWMLIGREHFFQQPKMEAFLETMQAKVRDDAKQFESLRVEFEAIARLFSAQLDEQHEVGQQRRVKRWICDPHGNILPIRLYSGSYWNQSADEQFLASIQQRRFELSPASFQSNDELVFRVYCADHTYTTLRSRLDEKAAEIKLMAAKKLRLQEKELILVHVKSNGERIVFNDLDTNISTSLSVNGRLFVGLLDHIDAISPLPEQDPHQEMYRSAGLQPTGAEGAASMPNGSNNNADNSLQADLKSTNNSNTQAMQTTPGEPQLTGASQQPSGQLELGQQSSNQHQLQSTPTNLFQIRAQMALSPAKLEEFSSRDIAYCLTQLAWSLLKNMHEYELIYNVFGRSQLFKEQMITANSNVFLRHFNEIQYWVVTEICLSTSLSKRVQMLRKFIKIAAHCKDLQNLNAAFAIIMGLSNMAVARLTQTWERLPGKLKRLFSQFESLIDPSRNHRRYRIFISKMEPPMIPFMPLFLKDMTFAHEGNQTYLENGLINFEKMQMVAQTLRTLRYCKSRPMKLNPSVCKYKGSVRAIDLFLRDLKIIDNQRTLTQLSHQLEHRKN